MTARKWPPEPLSYDGVFGLSVLDGRIVAADFNRILRDRNELLAALKEIQWGAAPVTDDSRCPYCLGRYHESDCEVAFAIARAEAPNE